MNKKYMLDTNIVIYVIKQRPISVLERFLAHDPSEFCISAITLSEMQYGISKSSNPVKNQIALASFLSNIAILPYDDSAAVEYGEIRAHLEKMGTPIGPNDLLIAAHAKAMDLTIVTNNVKEFERVPELKLENWV
ncbi:type II toxin-antitoxin system tRNA(fMet)-specific endonuclease VapC [Bilifractor sp. HCP3S3_D3]|uniref:type II toxin-antitoxin system tRNA(fMet)-specific endonuclease VapC n=1 Tax=Bilifractor sp. HCP3S3_D3 TaxID=3438907 RepID=UPI003F8B5048